MHGDCCWGLMPSSAFGGLPRTWDGHGPEASAGHAHAAGSARRWRACRWSRRHRASTRLVGAQGGVAARSPGGQLDGLVVELDCKGVAVGDRDPVHRYSPFHGRRQRVVSTSAAGFGWSQHRRVILLIARSTTQATLASPARPTAPRVSAQYLPAVRVCSIAPGLCAMDTGLATCAASAEPARGHAHGPCAPTCARHDHRRSPPPLASALRSLPAAPSHATSAARAIEAGRASGPARFPRQRMSAAPDARPASIATRGPHCLNRDTKAGPASIATRGRPQVLPAAGVHRYARCAARPQQRTRTTNHNHKSGGEDDVPTNWTFRRLRACRCADHRSSARPRPGPSRRPSNGARRSGAPTTSAARPITWVRSRCCARKS